MLGGSDPAPLGASAAAVSATVEIDMIRLRKPAPK